jgi:integrase
MARHPTIKIENKTERVKLPPRPAPHGFVSIGPGLRLGYRRVKDKTKAGTWVVKQADGKGGDKREVLDGVADDFQAADGSNVLDFHQAAEKARGLYLGGASLGAPMTWAEALDDYERALVEHGGNPANAGHVRGHLTRSAPELLKKSVAQLTGLELKRWRTGLLDYFEDRGMKRSSVIRLCKSACASLNHAASLDDRIKNREAWKNGLSGLRSNHKAIDRVLPDDVVRRIVAEAYADDAAFGLFVQVAAETGNRPSQIARLKVSDLKAGAAPELQMPSSRKGKQRDISHTPVPISSDLATRLQAAAKGRKLHEPLLLRADGSKWNPADKRHLRDSFAIIAARIGITETMYSLRHSSIVRSLLRGVPLQLCASLHDTSPRQMQATYAKFIAENDAGKIARLGLLDLAPVPVAA